MRPAVRSSRCDRLREGRRLCACAPVRPIVDAFSLSQLPRWPPADDVDALEAHDHVVGLIENLDERSAPRSDLLLERSAWSTVTRTDRISPGRTGLTQRNSVGPVPFEAPQQGAQSLHDLGIAATAPHRRSIERPIGSGTADMTIGIALVASAAARTASGAIWGTFATKSALSCRAGMSAFTESLGG